MKILITGGAGFIGSHLAEKLLAEGHHVTILDNLSTGRYANIAHVDQSQPMDILISQDCSGFNLGSFLVRRSEFTRRVLDMWWDPIFYEQM
jgi:mannan polymerase II complex MNN10 subunit